MKSDDATITDEDLLVLLAALTLLKQLRHPLAYYRPILGDFSRFFAGSGGRRGTHNPAGRSVAQARRFRAH